MELMEQGRVAAHPSRHDITQYSRSFAILKCAPDLNLLNLTLLRIEQLLKDLSLG